MPATGAKLHAFADALAARYALQPVAQLLWAKETPLFRINFVVGEARSADQNSTLALYEDATGEFAAWLNAKPECGTGKGRVFPTN